MSGWLQSVHNDLWQACWKGKSCTARLGDPEQRYRAQEADPSEPALNRGIACVPLTGLVSLAMPSTLVV